MDSPKVNHVSLCTGYGGIDLGLRGIVRDLRTVAYCEIEAFVIANLVSKMEAGLLDAAPLWPDIKTFPFGKFHGLVDILSGGYPCQPWSAAGKRKGKDDPRHLWPWIADGIRLCEPRFCFFENVEGHVSLGLSTVVSDLEELGYEVSWGIFSAAEVGAPHQRKRVFILASRDVLADADRLRLERPRLNTRKQEMPKPSDSRPGEREDVAHSDREGLEGQSGDVHVVEESGRLGQEQDGPSAASRLCPWPARPGRQQFCWEPPRISSFVKSCTPESEVGGGCDGASRGLGDAELFVSCDNRTDELRILGNGVVPVTAARAFSILLDELIIRSSS